MRPQRGFTLVELVIVLVILGLISAYALPRFFDLQRFDDRGFYSEVLNATRYAQQLAVAVNCNTRVTLTSNSYTVNLDDDAANCSAASFTTPVTNPATGQSGFSGSNSTVTVTFTSASITFNALGAVASNVDVTVGTTPSSIPFCVNGTTGYISEAAC